VYFIAEGDAAFLGEVIDVLLEYAKHNAAAHGNEILA